LTGGDDRNPGGRAPASDAGAGVLHGIGLKVTSVLVLTLMAICIKASAPHVPPGERVFFRSFFAIPVILVWLAWEGKLRYGLRTTRPFGHIWRGIVGTCAMALNFTALGLLPLPEVTVIGYTAPILVVVLAALVLGEEVRIFRLSAVLVGMIGVAIVLSPRLTIIGAGGVTHLQTMGALAALGAAAFSAWAMVIVRGLVHSESTAAIVIFFSISASVLGLMTLPFGWVVPTGPEAVLLVLSGLLGGIGQILLTEAYRHAPAGTIAPFDYSSMLFALVFGYLIFSEVPTLTTLAGAALVVAAGLFIIWRERQIGLRRSRARSVTPP
jgi:drug/metabolite transporter (DMT)-like permease